MRHDPSEAPDPELAESILSELTEELTRELQARGTIDIDKYVAEHPDQAPLLRELTPTLRELIELGRSLDLGRRARLEPGIQ